MVFSDEDDKGYRRWYDSDPALSSAMEHLRNAGDAYQALIALNIIKIIIEHKIEDQSRLSIEDLERYLETPHKEADNLRRRRWYDVNQTLHSAVQMLRDCPEDLQHTVIPVIVRMIEQTLLERI